MNQQKITVCAFIHKDGKLFAPRRAETKAFLPGKYELPGGHVEFGESLEDALTREIQEEFGFEIEIGQPFFAFTYLRDNDTVHSVEIDYFATLKNPEEEITLNPEDHAEYRWLSAEEVPDFYDKDPEYDAIIKGFELLNT